MKREIEIGLIMNTKIISSVVFAIATFSMPAFASAELVSPVNVVADFNRGGSDTQGRGASIYTINGSGFSNGTATLGEDPTDIFDETFWYVLPGGATSSQNPPLNLYYDLGEEKTLSEVYLWQVNGDSNTGDLEQISVDYLSTGSNPTFSLSGLNSQAWNNGISGASLSAVYDGITISFPSMITTRYLRLTIESAEEGNAFQYGFNEFAVGEVSGPVNTSPVITSISNQTNTEGESVSLNVAASDADGDALTYSQSGLPQQLALDSGTGEITGTVTTAGTYNVTVTVDDGNGGTDSTSFTWSVEEVVIPPSSAELVSPVNVVADFNRGGSDTQGRGASIYTINGSGFSNGTATLGEDPTDIFDETFWYVLPGGATSSQNPPLNLYYDLGEEKTLSEVYLWQVNGDSNTGDLEQISVDYLSTGSNPTFSLSGLNSQAWNNGISGASLSAVYDGITISFPSMITTRYLRLTIESAEEGNAFQYGFNEFAVGEVSGPVNTSPVITSISNQTNTEGESVSLNVAASDADGDALTYSQSGLPQQLALDSGTGEITGTVTTAGTYNVTVTVDDGNGGTDNESFVWTVVQIGGAVGVFDNVPIPTGDSRIQITSFDWFEQAKSQYGDAPDDPVDWLAIYNNTINQGDRVVTVNTCDELRSATVNSAPGDMILVGNRHDSNGVEVSNNSDTYFGCSVFIRTSGTSDKPIIITSESKVFSQAGETILFSGGKRFLVFEDGASHYLIGGLRMQNQTYMAIITSDGLTEGTEANPIYRDGSTDIRVTDSHFEGIGVMRGSKDGVIDVGVRSHRFRIDHNTFIANYSQVRYDNFPDEPSTKDARVDHNYFGPAIRTGFLADVPYEIAAFQTNGGAREDSDDLTLLFENNVIEHPITTHVDGEMLEIKTSGITVRANIAWSGNSAGTRNSTISLRQSHRSLVENNYLVGAGVTVHGAEHVVRDNFIDGEGTMRNGITMSRWGRRQPTNCTTLPPTHDNVITQNTILNTSEYGMRIGDEDFGARRPIEDSQITQNYIESNSGVLLHFNTQNLSGRTSVCDSSTVSKGSLFDQPGDADGGVNTGIVFDGNTFAPSGAAVVGSAFALDQNAVLE